MKAGICICEREGWKTLTLQDWRCGKGCLTQGFGVGMEKRFLVRLLEQMGTLKIVTLVEHTPNGHRSSSLTAMTRAKNVMVILKNRNRGGLKIHYRYGRIDLSLSKTRTLKERDHPDQSPGWLLHQLSVVRCVLLQVVVVRLEEVWVWFERGQKLCQKLWSMKGQWWLE